MYVYIFQKINCRVVTPQMHYYELRIILLRLTSQKMICYDVTFTNVAFFQKKKYLLSRWLKGKIGKTNLKLPRIEIYEFLTDYMSSTQALPNRETKLLCL